MSILFAEDTNGDRTSTERKFSQRVLKQFQKTRDDKPWKSRAYYRGPFRLKQ